MSADSTRQHTHSSVRPDPMTRVAAASIIVNLPVSFDDTDFENVQFANIDLGNIGGANDAAVVTLPDGTTVTFSDADNAPDGFTFSDLNDNEERAPDILTVNRDTNPINLNSGDAFVFSTPAGQAVNQDFRVQRISLHLTEAETVPEPSSLAILGLLGGVVAIRRRR